MRKTKTALRADHKRGKWARYLSKEQREAFRKLKWEKQYDERERKKLSRLEAKERKRRLAEAKKAANAAARAVRKAQRQRERREERRWLGVPADRRCPKCGEVKVSRAAWSGGQCKKCAYLEFKAKEEVLDVERV